ISKNPLKESFTKKENLRMVLIALFGATAGQGVVWYTGQFYAMTFRDTTCRTEFDETRNIIGIALMIGTPLFIYFGWLSDRYGRKVIMMLGMLLAVILYRPIYMHMYAISDLSQKTELTELKEDKIVMHATESGDSVAVHQTVRVFSDGTQARETWGTVDNEERVVKKEVTISGELYWGMIGMVLIQVVLVTMVYGPIAAFLVEIFPTRIRYTSMSLPYHIGNGVFGGLAPFIASWLYARSKPDAVPDSEPFAGLWYPIVIAGITFVIGMIFPSNRRKAEVMN